MLVSDLSNLVGVRGFNWKLPTCDYKSELAIKQRFGLSGLTAAILINRGFSCGDTLERFLYPSLKSSMPDPMIISGMKSAVDSIVSAILGGTRIGIIGDYDVDGASSSSLLIRYLSSIKSETVLHIPDRITEGYGPSNIALNKLKKEGCKLCIMVDCGTSAHQMVDEFEATGINVVVVDHHLPSSTLPNATAIVNPNMVNDASGLGYLCAAGIVFMLLVALNRSLRNSNFFHNSREEPDLINLLDIVALGTVCDMVPLKELNRTLVAQGLKVMQKRGNVGITTLYDISGPKKKPDEEVLAYVLGPHINAGGRIGIASIGAQLLSTNSTEEAFKLSYQLQEFNKKRKQLEQEAIDQAILQGKEIAERGNKFLTISGNWHQGIIGLIASKVKDALNLPVAILTTNTQNLGVLKASVRSMPGFDIGSSVINAKILKIIEDGGGHKMAAGFSIKKENIEKLSEFLNYAAEKCSINVDLDIDAVLDISTVNKQLYSDLKLLSPFGSGNASPKIVIPNSKMHSHRKLGANGLAFVISSGNKSLSSVAFNIHNTELRDGIMSGSARAVVGNLVTNSFNGRETLQFLIEDMLPW